MRAALGTFILSCCTPSAVAFVSFHTPRYSRRFSRPNRSELSCTFDKQKRDKLQRWGTRRELLRSVTYIPAAALASTVAPSSAISPQEAASSYDKFAASYDTLDGGSVASALGINEARVKMIGMAKGKVLEIGAGTGLNLDKYKFASTSSGRDGVSSLTLLDISDGMLAESKKKLMSMKIPSWVELNFIKADATSPVVTDIFGKGSFDTIVDTFSFCVMGENGAKKCLEQMRNVVKAGADGGQLLLIENTKSSNALIGMYQDATADTAAKMGGKGCVSNQDVKSFINAVDGLTLISEEEYASGLFRSFICVR